MEDSQCSSSLKHLGVCTTEKQLCVYVNTHTEDCWHRARETADCQGSAMILKL